MNAEIKQRWLEALRSGRYTQGHHQLRNENQCFCCLGVLCDVSGLGRWDADNSYVVDEDPARGRNRTYLPSNLRRAIGLPLEFQTVLSLRNDHGQGFATIADCIEENL